MSHPYYPTDLDIVNYVPNDKSQLELLLTFGTLVVCLSAVFFRWTHSPFRLIWFVLCGLLHCGFELYWLLNRDRIASQNDLLAQLWKEYGKGDSRYMVMDKQLILLESLTIFIYGPLCFITAYLILTKSSRQYFFQLTVSLCHLLSCTQYFLTELPEAIHCDPSPFYFWVYLVAFNAPWVIVPLLCLVQSYQHIHQAFDHARIKHE
ncbi:hypothetical protein G6F43_009029 [Rhizopus delemar]|nr:hypothetical protein G6F43_009029 [Rhizopus delemar]